MNNFFRQMKLILTAFPIFFAVILSGCSGGGGDAITSSNIVSGVASKGLLNGSKVCAYAISNGAKGNLIGT